MWEQELNTIRSAASNHFTSNVQNQTSNILESNSSQRVMIPTTISRYSTPRFTSKALNQLLLTAGSFFSVWTSTKRKQKVHLWSTNERLWSFLLILTVGMIPVESKSDLPNKLVEFVKSYRNSNKDKVILVHSSCCDRSVRFWPLLCRSFWIDQWEKNNPPLNIRTKWAKLSWWTWGNVERSVETWGTNMEESPRIFVSMTIICTRVRAVRKV